MHAYLHYMHWKEMYQNNTCDHFWVVILQVTFLFFFLYYPNFL